jgi:hypothetical protein
MGLDSIDSNHAESRRHIFGDGENSNNTNKCCLGKRKRTFEFRADKHCISHKSQKQQPSQNNHFSFFTAEAFLQLCFRLGRGMVLGGHQNFTVQIRTGYPPEFHFQITVLTLINEAW